MFDKLHEECGVFAIYGHPEAANLTYLGLHALQHRGQESAGISSCDHRSIHTKKAMGHVGGYRYTAEEQSFADRIRPTLTNRTAPAEYHEGVLPPETGVLSASTDVGDVSWNVPTAQFLGATWVPGTAAHTWQSTAASGMSIGQKGMLVAAKTMALTALDLLTDAKTVAAARTEFDKAMQGREYRSIHPKEVRMR